MKLTLSAHLLYLLPISLHQLTYAREQRQTSNHVNLNLSPGPGLPSLEQLGLTIDDLLQPEPQITNLVIRNTLAALFHPVCYHVNTATVGAVMLCYNYLNKIGSQTCMANRDATWTYMCNSTIGDHHAYVRGQPASGLDEISSPCSDVAKGMEWVTTECPDVTCKLGDSCPIGGTNAAWANGDFVIEIVGNASVLSSS